MKGSERGDDRRDVNDERIIIEKLGGRSKRRIKWDLLLQRILLFLLLLLDRGRGGEANFIIGKE